MGDADRAALIARLGDGARFDAPEAPHHTLLLARRATAYFARLLNDLPDDLLVDKPVGPGPSRARVVAAAGYHARGLTRLLSGEPDYASEADRLAEIERGSSLPPRALRGLFQHAAKHLDVEWRDLPGTSWDMQLHPCDGDRLVARDTPRVRAEILWSAAISLDRGARWVDIPAEFQEKVAERLSSVA